MDMEELEIRRKLVALRRQYAREGTVPSPRVTRVLRNMLAELGVRRGRDETRTHLDEQLAFALRDHVEFLRLLWHPKLDNPNVAELAVIKRFREVLDDFDRAHVALLKPKSLEARAERQAVMEILEHSGDRRPLDLAYRQIGTLIRVAMRDELAELEDILTTPATIAPLPKTPEAWMDVWRGIRGKGVDGRIVHQDKAYGDRERSVVFGLGHGLDTTGFEVVAIDFEGKSWSEYFSDFEQAKKTQKAIRRAHNYLLGVRRRKDTKPHQDPVNLLKFIRRMRAVTNGRKAIRHPETSVRQFMQLDEVLTVGAVDLDRLYGLDDLRLGKVIDKGVKPAELWALTVLGGPHGDGWIDGDFRLHPELSKRGI